MKFYVIVFLLFIVLLGSTQAQDWHDITACNDSSHSHIRKHHGIWNETDTNRTHHHHEHHFSEGGRPSPVPLYRPETQFGGGGRPRPRGTPLRK